MLDCQVFDEKSLSLTKVSNLHFCFSRDDSSKTGLWMHDENVCGIVYTSEAPNRTNPSAQIRGDITSPLVVASFISITSSGSEFSLYCI
jgi:hypothetical protein